MPVISQPEARLQSSRLVGLFSGLKAHHIARKFFLRPSLISIFFPIAVVVVFPTEEKISEPSRNPEAVIKADGRFMALVVSEIFSGKG